MKPFLAADLFCGAGGASTALIRAAAALGVPVKLIAINHWPTAVSTHELNHPDVTHRCQDLATVNPRKEVPGGRLNLLLAGPECTHHSSAAGGRPINDQSRETAWAVVKWAQELYIDAIIIENVPEFRSWGPIGANNRPLKSKKGQTFKAYIETLKSLDYRVFVAKLVAADYGDATTRERLFIMCVKRSLSTLGSVAWPVPTHSKTGDGNLFGGKQKWRAAREIIDWNRKGRSIFNRKKPLAVATMQRIMAGLDKFGGTDLKPFLVVMRNHMAGRSVDVPLPTISAQGQHVGLAQPFMMNLSHGRRLHDDGEPLPTITTARGGELAVVTPFVLGQQTGSVPRSVDSPIPTVSTDGAIQLVEPYMVPLYSERPTQTPRTHSIDEPVPTIPATGGGKFGLVAPVILANNTNNVPRPVDAPLATITGGNRLGIVDPVIIDTRGIDMRGRVKSPDAPLGAVTGSNRFAVAEPFLTKYNGTAKTAQSVNDPLDTVTAKDRLAVAEPFLVQTSERRREAVDSVEAPLRTITATGGRCFGLAQPVVNGYKLDILFRMLHHTELSAAMSFPPDYQFKGTQEDIVKQIGNAWPGELAKALCTVILKPYAARYVRHQRNIARKERTA